jgi:Bacteriophage CI repressor helix-turn-helix domain.
MSKLQAKVPAFEYKGGRSVTDKLKEITGSRDFLSLADVYGVPKSTISTWHQRELCPFEVVIRTHLKYGASIRNLVLDEGPMYDSGPKGESLVLERLASGSLEEIRKTYIDAETLSEYGLSPAIAKVVDTESEKLFIDTTQTKPISGRYLINMDGVLSVNSIQRIPGKRLAIHFEGSNVEVNDEDLEVIGRVVMAMTKE